MLDDGSRAVFIATKSDNTDINTYCIIERNSTIVYEFDKETANVAGRMDCELRVYDSKGKLITSPRFIMVVDARVTYSNAEDTAKYVDVLDECVSAEIERNNAENIRIENEDSRKEAEISRTTNENKRIENENSRNEAENTRSSNENKRIENESSRVEAENIRIETEEVRKESETDRENAEEERAFTFDVVREFLVDDESVFIKETGNAVLLHFYAYSDQWAVGLRFIVEKEDTPDFTYLGKATSEEIEEAQKNGTWIDYSLPIFEDITFEFGKLYVYGDCKLQASSKKLVRVKGIKDALDDREKAENLRIANEKVREEAEVERIDNEYTRGSNEESRIKAENTRNSAEQERVSAEVSRVNAETVRDNAEKARIKAENERKQTLTELTEKVESVTEVKDYAQASLNLAIGESSIYEVNNFDDVITELGYGNLNVGDVFLLNGDVDFTYLGWASASEIETAQAEGTYYTQFDYIINKPTFENGKLYIYESRKFLASTKNLNVLVRREELKSYVDTSIQSAILNSWEGAV
jgi:hypothetical protein